MKCKLCKREPNQINEYVECSKLLSITPEEYIEKEEGTFNKETQEFYCTECYIMMGMPEGKA